MEVCCPRWIVLQWSAFSSNWFARSCDNDSIDVYRALGQFVSMKRRITKKNRSFIKHAGSIVLNIVFSTSFSHVFARCHHRCALVSSLDVALPTLTLLNVSKRSHARRSELWGSCWWPKKVRLAWKPPRCNCVLMSRCSNLGNSQKRTMLGKNVRGKRPQISKPTKRWAITYM